MHAPFRKTSTVRRKTGNCFSFCSTTRRQIPFLSLFPRNYFPGNKEEVSFAFTKETSSLKNRRRPTLPGRFQPSTLGAWGLNCRVRDGNGWNPPAITTGYRGCNPHNCIEEIRLNSRFEVKASTDSYPSAPSVAGLPHRADQPRHLQGVLLSCEMRDLILGLVSRLDAFSVSPFRT